MKTSQKTLGDGAPETGAPSIETVLLLEEQALTGLLKNRVMPAGRIPGSIRESDPIHYVTQTLPK